MEIIKSSDEISFIFKEGKRISLADLMLIVTKVPPQRDQVGRVAFIAGKKQGNAVWRNRAKRRMRALYRDVFQEYDGILKRFDILLIARRQTTSVSYQHLLAQITKGIAQISSLYKLER